MLLLHCRLTCGKGLVSELRAPGSLVTCALRLGYKGLTAQYTSQAKPPWRGKEKAGGFSWGRCFGKVTMVTGDSWTFSVCTDPPHRRHTTHDLCFSGTSLETDRAKL